MEIKHLKTFLIASKTLNFTKTAKILDYAQSSITAQIKTLETELGTVLFERLGKRIFLTKKGIELQKYAEEILKLDSEMRSILNEDGKSSATLTIGAQESQCTYRLPSVLDNYKKNYPQLNLIFKPIHSSEIAEDSLQRSIIDLALITDVKKDVSTLYSKDLLKEEILLVASPKHNLVFDQEIELKCLKTETLLLTEKGCSYRTQFESKLNLEGIHPVNIIEFVSIEAIKKCVEANLGISFLPAMAVEKEINNGSLVKLNINLEIEPIYTQLAWHKDKYISSYLEELINIIEDQYIEI